MVTVAELYLTTAMKRPAGRLLGFLAGCGGRKERTDVRAFVGINVAGASGNPDGVVWSPSSLQRASVLAAVRALAITSVPADEQTSSNGLAESPRPCVEHR